MGGLAGGGLTDGANLAYGDLTGDDTPGGADAPSDDTSGSTKVRWIAAAVALVVAGVVGTLIYVFAVSDTQQSALVGRGIVCEDEPANCQPAPPIQGDRLGGGSYDLNHDLGRWVVVNFFASWCTGCILEYPELVEFHERHQATGAASVVTVVFNDTIRAVEESVMGQAPWPVVVGENINDTGKIAVEYSVTALPETYVISPEGVVVEKLVGASGVTADALEAVILRESQERVDQ